MSLSLLPPGQCVKSIYTFNAVSALCFVPEGDGYIVTGSGVCVFSFNIKEKSVTQGQKNVVVKFQLCI